MLTAVRAGQPIPFERKPATFPGEDRNSVDRKYLRSAGVGVQFAITILVLTLLGIWLDGRFGTGFLFTVSFLLLGFVGATISLVRQVLGPDKPVKPNKADGPNKPDLPNTPDLPA